LLNPIIQLNLALSPVPDVELASYLSIQLPVALLLEQMTYQMD